MSQQMSLFPTVDIPEKSLLSEGAGNALDEVFNAIQRLISSQRHNTIWHVKITLVGNGVTVADKITAWIVL